MLKQKLENYIKDLEQVIKETNVEMFENQDEERGRIDGYKLVLSDIKHILSQDSDDNLNEDFYAELKRRHDDNDFVGVLEMLESNGIITEEEYEMRLDNIE